MIKKIILRMKDTIKAEIEAIEKIKEKNRIKLNII